MKFWTFIFSLLFFTFLSISFISADIKTKVNIVDSNNGSFKNIREGDELSLIYDFTTGEKIIRQIYVSDEDSLDLSKHLFCYENCNIVPKREIYKTWVKDTNETLSIINAKIDGYFIIEYLDSNFIQFSSNNNKFGLPTSRILKMKQKRKEVGDGNK